MDEYQIMNILLRLETGHLESFKVVRDYAKTLSDISERLSDDQLRRILMLSAYLCQRVDEAASGPAGQKDSEVAWRGNTRLS